MIVNTDYREKQSVHSSDKVPMQTTAVLVLQDNFLRFISARQHICYSALYAIARVRPSVRPSVRLSVTHVDQSKTVEVMITQPLPQIGLMTLVS